MRVRLSVCSLLRLNLPDFKSLGGTARIAFFMICVIQSRFFFVDSTLEDFFSVPAKNSDKMHLFFTNRKVALEKSGLFAELLHVARVLTGRRIATGRGDKL
jgi:hypothetical protein